jgi:hypothetical protein
MTEKIINRIVQWLNHESFGLHVSILGLIPLLGGTVIYFFSHFLGAVVIFSGIGVIIFGLVIDRIRG